MKITSVYDDGIVYDTESKTINGSKIANRWISDGEDLFKDSHWNYKMLSNPRKGVSPYTLYETENGKFYCSNGAKWSGLLPWEWNGKMHHYYYDEYGHIKNRKE